MKCLRKRLVERVFELINRSEMGKREAVIKGHAFNLVSVVCKMC